MSTGGRNILDLRSQASQITFLFLLTYSAAVSVMAQDKPSMQTNSVPNDMDYTGLLKEHKTKFLLS